MSCANCYHQWCWVCGYSQDHWFHKIGGVFIEGQVLCGVINGWAMGFELNAHWILRVLLMILILCLFPLAYAIGFSAYVFMSVWEKSEKYQRKWRLRCSWSLLVVLPLYIIAISLLLAISFCIGTAIECILLVPQYIVLTVFCTRIFYLWVLSSKKADKV